MKKRSEKGKKTVEPITDPAVHGTAANLKRSRYKRRGQSWSVRDSAPLPLLEHRSEKVLKVQEPAVAVLSDTVERIARETGLAEAGRLLVEVFDQQVSRLGKPQAPLGFSGAVLRGRVAREELKTEEGGSISSQEAAKRLGISKQAVLKRFHLRQLLGWREAKQGAVRMPVWQFVDDNVLSGLPETLCILRQASWMDDWAGILFFLNRRASLKGERPLDLLRKGEKATVLQAALDEIQ